MLDDKDEFREVSIFAEHCLREAQNLIQLVAGDQTSKQTKEHLHRVLRYRYVVEQRVDTTLAYTKVKWHQVIRDFMVKFGGTIDEAIRSHVSD